MKKAQVTMHMFSDLEYAIEQGWASVKNKELKNFEIQLDPLPFHQDNTYNQAESSYEYLYFQVLGTEGFTAHNSLIAIAKKNAIPLKSNHPDQAVSYSLEYLEPNPIVIPCTKGSGYAIDQSKEPRILHGHDGFKTFLSIEEICPEMNEKYKFTVEEGKKHWVKGNHPLPYRKVLVARIKLFF